MWCLDAIFVWHHNGESQHEWRVMQTFIYAVLKKSFAKPEVGLFVADRKF